VTTAAIAALLYFTQPTFNLMLVVVSSIVIGIMALVFALVVRSSKECDLNPDWCKKKTEYTRHMAALQAEKDWERRQQRSRRQYPYTTE